jgi:hypothetical protein
MSEILREIDNAEYPIHGIIMCQRGDTLQMLVMPIKFETEQELREEVDSEDSREDDVVALYPDTGNIGKMLNFYRYAKRCGCSVRMPTDAIGPWGRVVSIPEIFGTPKMFWENHLRLEKDKYESIIKQHRDEFWRIK